MKHKSGIVNFIGLPNVGKSSLLNALSEQKLSIVSHKPQTTRNRIRSIQNTEDYQIVWCDNPGIIDEPHYLMQESLNEFNREALTDSDILVLVVDIGYNKPENEPLFGMIQSAKVPTIILLNKADKIPKPALAAIKSNLQAKVPDAKLFAVSALKPSTLKRFVQKVIKWLPEQPAFFDKEYITDHHLRFLAAEMIREKIFLLLEDELPYCSFVAVTDYKESDTIDKIYATVFVERESQKKIFIGAAGDMIRNIGTQARKDIERFLDKRVFLEIQVKVRENWRNNPQILQQFGLKQEGGTT